MKYFYGKTIFISPLPYMHFVKDHTHLAFNCNYGPFLNKLTYSLANFGMITKLMISIKWLKIKEKMIRKPNADGIINKPVTVFAFAPATKTNPQSLYRRAVSSKAG